MRKKIAPPAPSGAARSGRWALFVLAALFLFRLLFGLSTDIWYIDQRQIYLLGLKFYTTGLWPFFGPDVAAQIQLPGALQGLLVGLPLYLLPVPEAPYLLLALLSFSSLSFLAWYICRRLPGFPAWIVWTWVLTAPWTLNWSTNIDNDSYALTGAVLFFIGFLESAPAFSLKLLSPALANALAGFGFFWCFQLHMSYVLLAPFLLYSLYTQWKGGVRGPIPALLLGSLASGLFLVPTWAKYGLAGGTGGMGKAVAFHPGNALDLAAILGRFLALASCEIPRFIGANSQDRSAFLAGHPWTAPFACLAALLGAAQVLALLALFFQKAHPNKDWRAVRLLALLTFLDIYASFFFAIKAPAAHTYYITLPIVMLYSFYAFSPWAGKEWFRTTAKVLLACNLLFHLGLALDRLPSKSLYADRDLVAKAIQEKNYHLMGERRPGTLY